MAIVDQRENQFTLGMIMRELRKKMQVPENRGLDLDDSWHGACVPAMLTEKDVNWFIIEWEMPEDPALIEAGRCHWLLTGQHAAMGV